MQAIKRFIKEYYSPIIIFAVSRMVIFMTVLLADLNGIDSTRSLLNWDASNYAHIAENGYLYDGTFKGSNAFIAYYPLLPMLLRFVHMLTGLTYVASGILISTIFSIGCVILLYKLIRDWAGSQAARVGVTLFSFYPMSVFLSTAYTESIIIFVTLAALVLIERNQQLRASVFVALSFLTRVTGSVLGLIFIYDVWKTSKSIWKTTWMSLLAGIPFLTFLYFQYQAFGTPFAFLIAQHEFFTEAVTPWTGLWIYIQTGLKDFYPVHVWRLELFFALLVIVTLVLSYKKIPKYIWWFSLGVLLTTLCSDHILGMGRYMMPALAIYFYWGKKLSWKQTTFAVVIAVFAGWMVLNTLLFITGKHLM